MLEVLLALGAAACYAVATVVQHRAAASVPQQDGGPIRLLLRLTRNRRWLAGKGADVAALALQALALARGSLVVVQAMLASGVVMALGLNAALEHRRLQPRQWFGSLGIVTGLTMLIAFGNPGGGRHQGTPITWVIAVTLVIAVVGAALAYGRNLQRSHIGVIMALGTAACFSFDAASLKAGAETVRVQGWALVAVAAAAGYLLAATVGNVLVQRAFQLAPLSETIPTLTAGQPVIGLGLGALVYHENVRGGAAHVVLGWVGVVLLTVGCVVASRSTNLERVARID